MGPLELRAYEDAMADLAAAGRGRSREIVRRLAHALGRSEATVYRRLGELGWESGRKPRADRGRSRVGGDGLREVSRMMAKARNARGQPNLTTKDAHQIAQELGLGAGEVSYGHLARRLREEGLGLRHMRAPPAAIARVSQHPNQVWQFDISIAIHWYFRDPLSGKKLDLYMDGDTRFYPGKRQNFLLPRVVHRFALVDHYSGTSFYRYYYTPGERAEDVVDFLYQAFAPKGELHAQYPFRGIPRILVMDQGSANKSGVVLGLLKDLDVNVEFHAPGNAKASGAVENRHWVWQRRFEGRLATSGCASNLEELNERAAKFCAYMNGQVVHTRHGRPPLDLWNQITAEQLVECPDRDTFFSLAASTPKEGVLDNRLWLRASGRVWLIRGEHVHARQRVTWRLAPFLAQGIRVWDEHGRELAPEELSFNEAGFPENGRRHVWGDEEAAGATAPPTPAQQVSRAVKSGEETVELPGIWDDVERRLARQHYLERQGRTWTPAATASPAATGEPLMGELEARLEVANRLGRALGADGDWWASRIGTGITRSELDAAWAEWCGGATAVGRMG